VRVIAHRDPRVERDAVPLGRLAKAIQEDVFDAGIRSQQQLALGATTAHQVGASGNDLARHRHAAYIGTGDGELLLFRRSRLRESTQVSAREQVTVTCAGDWASVVSVRAS
jgi:hypothetical protein